MRQYSPAVVEAFKDFLGEGETKAWDCTLAKLVSTKTIDGLPPEQRGEMADAAFRFVYALIVHAMRSPGGFQWGGREHQKGQVVIKLAARLLKKAPPLDASATRCMLKYSGKVRSNYSFSVALVLDALQRHVETHGLDDQMREAAKRFESDIAGSSPKHVRRLGEILRGEESPSGAVLEARDAWSHALLQHLEASPDRAATEQLLGHCASLTSSVPSSTWREMVRSQVESLDRDVYRAATTVIVEAIGTAAPFPVRVASSSSAEQVDDGDPTLVAEASVDALRGWIWSTVDSAAASMLDALGSAAVRCFQKLPGVGPRSSKVGNAITNVLAEVGTFPAVAQLSRIKRSVKQASAKQQVDKALARVAKVTGVEPDDLEELATPTFGFTRVGQRDSAVADSTAHLRVRSGRTVELTWTTASAAAQASVPAAVERAHPDAVAALRSEVEAIERTLATVRARLEQQLRTQRSLPLDDWRTRYVDHPLAGWLSRRLIWRFGDDGPLGIVQDDVPTDLSGAPLHLEPSVSVHLWHPIESSADDVKRWRQRLSDLEITQPLKQAHREVYVLTDAERETDLYSNRFAGHILRQHQFGALCRERGWTFAPIGDFEPDDFPFLAFPDRPWRAELTLALPGTLHERTAAGISVHVATHQLRFVLDRGAQAVPLSDIPPLLFSEVMRDVDLFVGVSSVGKDPKWRDTGPRGELESYSHD